MNIIADVRLGWRRLGRSRVTSAAAVLSLALAIGASTAAFRLIDALLLRPLPIAHPELLYTLTRLHVTYESWSYPQFLRLRQSAPVIAISNAEQVDLTYGSDEAMEKGHVQYVSGGMFGTFGLRPAAGRLLAESDADPVAVLSDDYWARRFGRDPNVIGHTYRLADRLYQIVGVTNAGFTGTEPGTVIDIFMPAAMHWGVGHDWAVFRLFAQMAPGVRERLGSAVAEKAGESLVMTPAAEGASGLQKNYRLSLTALGVLVGLVLLIACANVANLMTAQAAARWKEMALRVSIGASRWRLVQLVLVESALVALLAAGGGVLFAWWAGPFVVRAISSADHPVRLFLPADWRVLGFGLALTLGVTLLFGLGPALRASLVTPLDRAGTSPTSRRRWMRGLIGVQAAFCTLVLFVAGLFVTTFERLAHQATGIAPERVLTLSTVTRKSQSRDVWEQVTEHLRHVGGVESAAISEWPILDGWGFRSSSITVDGEATQNGGWFLYIAPGLMDVMKMPVLSGRDFMVTDGGVAIVNQAFARQYFHGENPVGKWFEGSPTNSPRQRFQVVGMVRDARYRYLREGFMPVAYVPYHGGDRGTFIVRTAGANPLAMASILREEIGKARPGFRVSTIRTQAELIEAQTIRERLLATLALFFAGVALLLAGVGLYGVLNYSVIERRREIGIRLAIGAQAGRIARLVTVDLFGMVVLGAMAGLGVGMASVRFIETLFFGVKGTELAFLAGPGVVIIGVAILAALPGVLQAVRVDPVEALRAE